MKRRWLLLLFPVVLVAILLTARYFSGRRTQETPANESKAVLQDVKVASNLPRDEVPAKESANQKLAPEVVEKLSATLQKYIKENPKAPDIADAYFNLGNLYYQAGEYEKALTPLKLALAEHPYDSDARYTLGNTYDKLKRYGAAAREFELMAQIEPKNDTVFYNLANAYLNQKKYPEAVDKYKQAISLNPKSSSAHFGLGQAYQRLGKVKEAMAEFQEAVNLDANNAEAHFSLALAKLESGDRKAAQDEHEFLKKLNPGYAAELDKKMNEQN